MRKSYFAAKWFIDRKNQQTIENVRFLQYLQYQERFLSWMLVNRYLHI